MISNVSSISVEAIQSIPTRTRLEKRINFSKLIPLARREGNSKKPIYQMHKWWARRLGVNFRFLLLGATSSSSTHEKTIWNNFYKPKYNLNLTILDPFMGGGTSIVESTKLGARTIGVDLDPMAWFIVNNQINNFDLNGFKSEWNLVQNDLAEKITSYYKTSVKGKSADVINYFWVELIPCESCGHEFEGHIHHIIYLKKTNDGKEHGIVFCKNCHKLHELQPKQTVINCKCDTQTEIYNGSIKSGKYVCPVCHHEGRICDIQDGKLPLKRKLFALEYVDPKSGERAYKKAENSDMKLYQKANQELDRLWKELPIPSQSIPIEGRSDPRPVSLGYKKYSDLFNRRQLLCLSLIFQRLLQIENVAYRELFLLAFSDALACNNLFCSYAFGYQKLTPLFGLHAFRRISRPVEGNVWGTTFGRGSFSSSVEKVMRGKNYSAKPFEYLYTKSDPTRVELDNPAQATIVDDMGNLTQTPNNISYLTISDSRDLSWLPEQSVDIVLTDPPYYDNLAYSELSDFYYVWLRDYIRWPKDQPSQHTPLNESLFVRHGVMGEHERYTDGLTRAFSGCRRAIKPNGIMVFTYHHTNRKAWESLTLALHNADFRVTNSFPILSEGKSGFHSDDGNLKWDMVFVCRPSIKESSYKYRIGNVKRWVKTRINHWEKMAQSEGANFSEVDKRSFALGLVALYTANCKVSDEEIVNIIKLIDEQYPIKRGIGA